MRPEIDPGRCPTVPPFRVWDMGQSQCPVSHGARDRTGQMGQRPKREKSGTPERPRTPCRKPT
jgi:hypothetical protein